MILADTSVWIDYLKGRPSSYPLTELLRDKQIACHPWVIGELMVGNLGPHRNQILFDLFNLPTLLIESLEATQSFIEKERLQSKGLSFIDVNLLHSCCTQNHRLWTHDRKLLLAAKSLKIQFEP